MPTLVKTVEELKAEAVNEILSIQKATMEIATNGVTCKPTIVKKPVPLEVLEHLAWYFGVPVKPESEVYGTGPYINCRNNHADIIVGLITEA